ncbi:MAG: hypothetical protein GC161_11885 [Planctomycetaceae bacterium]|nr:hypothetical protein [Planctomycetaceae bacterium]
MPSGPHDPRDLPELARLLQERLRTADLVGRLHSNHLAALLPATDGQGAWIVAESVLHRLAKAGLKYDCKVYAYPCDPPANRTTPSGADAATDDVAGDPAAATAGSNDSLDGNRDGGNRAGGANGAAGEQQGPEASALGTHSAVGRTRPSHSRASGSSPKDTEFFSAHQMTRVRAPEVAGAQVSQADAPPSRANDWSSLAIDRHGDLHLGPRIDDEETSRELDAIRANASARQVESLVPLLVEPLPAWKRGMDILVSATALLVLSPLFAAIALAIKLDSKGPIIFRQQRAGAGGRPFTFFKFRSMLPNAEAMRAELEALNEKDGPIFKMKNDPRITRVGGFLRRWSLDELPQIYNVLRGDMSLVGPRPPTLNELPGYQSWQRRRLELTGGLTCIWQVSGRSDVSFEEWMRMDLRYARRRTLKRDLVLLAKTASAIVTSRGAY